MNDNVNYDAAAELFPSGAHGRVSYRRFDTLAEALRYAVEELEPRLLGGAFIEAEELRYGAPEIRALYQAQAYPLSRRN